ncbi:hypothetical protein ACIQCN_09565 [Pseudarthrobacter sp. NPDC092424]|uniref:hypothetical protein n=1 Tax=Pseudarthrobacter sp. NPDC092424 TaxID=3364415 RepID=UPI0037F6FEBA
MNPHAARVLDTVDQILLESGQQDATDLRAALLSMGTLAELPVPAPGPKLAAMLSGTPAHTTRREAMAREAAARQEVARKSARFRSDELARRRALRRNRSAVVGLTVMAGMGLGVTSVAASLPEATDNHASVQQLLENWAPRWTIAVPNAAADSVPTEKPVPGAVEPEAVDAAEGQDVAALTGSGQSGTAGNGKPRATESPDAAAGAGNGGRAADTGTKPAGAGKDREQRAPEIEALAERQAAKAGNSGTGHKASPGARWLKKFNQ